MTALDILMLLLVGGLGFRGVQNGFVTETLSLASWVLAIIAVKLLHGKVTVALVDRVGTAAGASVLAFALIFGGTYFLGRYVANRVGGASKSSMLGPFDRVLGLGFGALKGLIGGSLLFLFASLVYDTVYGGKSERPAWMAESRSYPLLNATSHALVDIVDERRKNGGAAAAEAVDK